jgi:hypothetical protein
MTDQASIFSEDEYEQPRVVPMKPKSVNKAPVNKDSQLIVLIEMWSRVLNARLLAVVALVGALGIFGFTIADPQTARLWGCAGYSVGVLWPVIWLYLRKGE